MSEVADRGHNIFHSQKTDWPGAVTQTGEWEEGQPLARGHGRVPHQDADRALASREQGSACPALPRHHSYT